MHSLSKSLYNSMVPGFRDYSDSKGAYIAAVDKIVLPYIQNARSIIDFGAGDGVRIKRLVGTVTADICLVENAAGMVDLIKYNLPNATIMQQDFSKESFRSSQKYDVAISLWNVIGHLDDESAVLAGLRNIKKSVKENGTIIIDVNNRHNIRQYGWKACRNIMRDMLFYNYSNGDVSFSMHILQRQIPANVHLFTRKEIENLFVQAGLRIAKRHFINYKTGKAERNQLFGQLLYVLSLEK